MDSSRFRNNLFIGYIGKKKKKKRNSYWTMYIIYSKELIRISCPWVGFFTIQKFKIVFHNIQNKSAVSIDMT